MRRICWARWQVSLLFIAVGTAWAAYGQTQVSGTVRDQSGAAIAGAAIELRSNAANATATTDSAGHFALGDADAHSILTVRARGFAPWSTPVEAVSGHEVEIVLRPDVSATELTVSATKTELPLMQSPASVRVVTPEQLETSAPVALDDVLRQVAGFDLFRRTSSNFSNPTTQGLSLRGVGSSGASRATVLVDGVPITDPFGNWVYWDRVPSESISSVEILRGGASALYGSSAMGGAINVLPRETAHSWLAADVNYGSLNTPDGSVAGGLSHGKWAATVAADAFSTDGYIMVDPSERGAVDVPADSSHRTVELTLSRKIGTSGSLFGRGSWFREERGNGTRLQVNDTDAERGIVGGDFTSRRAGSFSFRAYGGPELYHQSFSAIAADRDSETLSRLQRVPVQELGGWAQWSRALGSRNLVVAGADLRDVRGHSYETVISPAGAATSIVDAGGRQRNLGIFAEDVLRATDRLTVNAAVRLDRWRNFDSFSDSRSLTSSLATIMPLADRQENAFSPRAGANYRLNDKLSLTASAFRSFRAPSLNELYRTFRVGNVVTQANNNLTAEHLTGGEAGVLVSVGRVFARTEFFWNDVEQPIANVTLTQTATLITRQRQNLGSTRSAGLEAQLETKLSRSWFVSGEYQYAASIVTSFSAEPALVGLWVPQVPRHEFTFRTSYDSPRLFTASLQLRAVGQQFDDDLNQFPLESYARLDAFFERRIGAGVQAFIAAENLLNQRYSVGRTPVRTIAPPVQVRAGLRLRLPRT